MYYFVLLLLFIPTFQTQIISNTTKNSQLAQQVSNVTNTNSSTVVQQALNVTTNNSSAVVQQTSNGTYILPLAQQAFNVTNNSSAKIVQQTSNGTYNSPLGQQIFNVTRNNSSKVFQQSLNVTNLNTSISNSSLKDDDNVKFDDISNLPVSKIGDEQDITGVSNIHFHLTVPRYYSPYEEIPFLYFINSSNDTYIDQEKRYFSLHMGSTPYSPTYGLLISNLSSGSYTFRIGRAYNKTWVADAVSSADNSTFSQTIVVSDIYTTTSYEVNVQAWSDLYGENFVQSSNSSSDRIFLLRAHYKSIDCDMKRRIWMYLPPDYETATPKRYPVLYTYWGQLMFNYYGNSTEWNLDKLLNDAFYNYSSCEILKWGLIIVAIDALPTKLLSNQEYIVSRETEGCRSQNLIRTFSGSFKRHIHANFRTFNKWDYTTILGYNTAGGLVFDQMTKYYQKFGKFIILSWILDEDCCESEVEINDALATSRLFRHGNNLNKNNNNTNKTRYFPKIFFTWTLNEEPAEMTRARDNAKGLKHRGLPISNLYVDPVNATPTAKFYGTQTMKAICWLFNNQSIESYSDIAPWLDEDQLNINNTNQTTVISPQM